MVIEKNNFKVSKFDSDFTPSSRRSMSSDENELQRPSNAVESDEDDDFDDADSGAGSDDFDLLELGETGVEFCQVGNQTCSIPFELYDLSGLEDVFSMDVWNDCLSEDDRFGLTRFLPDMDQETYMVTLKELFTGCNFHFGSPIKRLFSMLKGGLCEPRVALYREGLNFFHRRQHYHLLRKHQNNLVSSICQIRDAWLNCRGYSIEERLRVLNIMRSQKSLMYEKLEDLEADLSEKESSEGLDSGMKDCKTARKVSGSSAYRVDSYLDVSSRGRTMALAPKKKYGKLNAKGNLKMERSKMTLAMDYADQFPLTYHNLDKNSAQHNSVVTLSRQNKAPGYGMAALKSIRDKMRSNYYTEEATHNSNPRGCWMENLGDVKLGKRHKLVKGENLVTESFMDTPPSSKTDLYGRKKTSKLLSDMNVFIAKPPDSGKKTKYSENAQQVMDDEEKQSKKVRVPQLEPRRNHTHSFWHHVNNSQGEPFPMDLAFESDEWKPKSKKQSKKGKTVREPPNIKTKSYRCPSPQLNDEILHSELRTKQPQEKARGKFVHPAGLVMAVSESNRRLKAEETESDSSEQIDDDGHESDSNLKLGSKLTYPSSSGVEVSQPSVLKSVRDARKVKNVTKMGIPAEHKWLVGVEGTSSRPKKKVNARDGGSSKMRNGGAFHDASTSRRRNDGGNGKIGHRTGKNGRLQGESDERFPTASESYPDDGKLLGEAGFDCSVAQSKNLRDYAIDDEDDSLEMPLFTDENEQCELWKRVQSSATYGSNRKRSEVPLLGCNSVNKKRRGKDGVTELDGSDVDGDLQSKLRQIDDSSFLKKNSKRKLEADVSNIDVETYEPPISDLGMEDMDQETKPQKKQFTLITPTVQTGFSFSIIHLLSAVRLAMITPLSEDTLEVEKHENNHDTGVNGFFSHEKVSVNSSKQTGEINLPFLNVHEIINRVRSNPGDPCILETQEPLQDLVRGVLKTFSSKTAPLGAKGWKALSIFDKSAKCWSWVGPVPQYSSDNETVEEVISPEAWGLPHKMVIKLVDSFANWLKSSQETLQQIGSLPAPPFALTQFNLDEKERFRDLRAQKSLNTINPSTEEVKAYVRREEVLRYSIPDRAFSYTAADGKKSIVAPLRRCGGKPTSKARDHFMLKRDRPPHVTILCLVRDAAARLPGSIGTRADVCTLLRDSQYVVEDVSDAQVNQVVSGALDRLHYERDPCVQFDGERKLWVYLHREREEEDFEDDGTSSTKKWKRQKKDPADQSDQGMVSVAYPGTGEHDLFSDINVEPSCVDDDNKDLGHACDEVRQNLEDNVDVDRHSEQGELQQGDQMLWDALTLNPVQENKLLCQENSTNEDFDDEAFGRERSSGLLSATIL